MECDRAGRARGDDGPERLRRVRRSGTSPTPPSNGVLVLNRRTQSFDQRADELANYLVRVRPPEPPPAHRAAQPRRAAGRAVRLVGAGEALPRGPRPGDGAHRRAGAGEAGSAGGVSSLAPACALVRRQGAKGLTTIRARLKIFFSAFFRGFRAMARMVVRRVRANLRTTRPLLGVMSR